MKKKIILMLSFVMLCSLLSGCGETKKITVTWALFNLKGDQQVYLDALNEVMEEKGLPYQIQFANVSIPFEGDYETYVNAYIEEIEKGDFDIITCPGVQNCYDTYKMIADKGLLVPWDNFLKNGGTGQKLKTAYPSPTWEAVKYDGVVYGVPTLITGLNYYAVFNVDYAEKYGIDLSTVRFSDLDEILHKAAEGEFGEGNQTFVPSTPWQHFWREGYEGSPCEMVYIHGPQGKWAAESMMDIEKEIEHLRLLNLWGSQGLVTCDDYGEAVSHGNFLVTAAEYSYSEEAAENLIKNSFSMPSAIRLQAVEFPEFNLKFKGNGYKVGVGAKSEHKEEAMEAVAAIYSDADLSNALVYGKEGESYYIENGLAFPMGDYMLAEMKQQISFGNPFLTMPSYKDSSNKKEELWKLIEESELSGLLGVTFDLEGIDETVCRLNVLLLEQYSDLLLGKSADVEGDLKALTEDANALGLETVLAELNRQLEVLQ